MNFDFLLKLNKGGFLGLVKSEVYHGDHEVLEIPNLTFIEKKPKFLIELESKDFTKSQEKLQDLLIHGATAENPNRKEEKQKRRLYYLTEYILQLAGEKSSSNKQIESFSLVISREVMREGLVTLRTIRIFHDQPIYVIADQETKEFLEQQGISNLIIKIDISEASKQRIMRRFFKKRFVHLQTFHREEYIFKKMDAMSFALKNHSNTFFLDADIILCEKLSIHSDREIILSPHYCPARRFYQTFGNGFFNAGYVFCCDKSFPRFWRRLYLKDSRFYEQQGMDYIPEKYSTHIFDASHNIGWWRNKNDNFNEPLNIVTPEKVWSFHLHLEPNYNYGDNSIVRKKNYEIKNIMLNYLRDNKKTEVIDSIASVFRDVKS